MAIRVTTAFESSPAARLTRARASVASANEHVDPTDALTGALPTEQFSRSLTGESRGRRGRGNLSPDLWQDVVSYGGPLVSQEIGALLVRLQEARGANNHLLIAPAEVERLMTMYQSSNDVGAPPDAPYEMSIDPESGRPLLTITPDESAAVPSTD